jgi:hypothetical protein
MNIGARKAAAALAAGLLTLAACRTGGREQHGNAAAGTAALVG